MQHRNDSMHGGHRPRSSGLLALLTVVLVPAMAVIVIGGFLLWRAPGATSPGTVAAVAAVGDAGGPTLREPLRRPGDRAIGRSGDRAEHLPPLGQ
jgi:hypothetical protein